MADPIIGEQQFIPNSLVTTQRTRFYRDPVSGVLSVQYSKDSGTTWRDFISEPSTLATEGWIPTLTATGNVTWRPILSLLTAGTAIGGGSSSAAVAAWTDFSFPASLFVNKQFGYFLVPSSSTITCYGAQLSVFSPSSGGDIVLNMLNIVNGAPQYAGQEIRLSQGVLIGATVFSSPVVMSPGTTWRMIATSVGTIDPGQFLTCRLMFSV
jgi:hypothetical protein